MTEEKTAEIVENTEKNGSACLKSRGDLARELFKEGYNCSQAVTLAFADELEARGISREMAAGLASLATATARRIGALEFNLDCSFLRLRYSIRLRRLVTLRICCPIVIIAMIFTNS